MKRRFASNIRHWIEKLGIDGLFISGKQGEFFSMSVEERKRTFDIALDATRGKAGTIMSCSDQNMDVVIDLARHAEASGADYIVVHAPVLHFLDAQDDTLYEYYRYIADKIDIGIALWSHPDSGYLMSPELCNRIADIPNVVAIKYSVPREMYARLTRLGGRQDTGLDRIGERVVRRNGRARMAGLSVLEHALPDPDPERSPYARVHGSRDARRREAGADYP